MDKRKDRRFTTQLYVTLRSGSINSWGVLCDVSESGLFIKCNRDLVLEKSIYIDIFMADNSISRLKGVVIRKIDFPDAQRKKGFGIQLIEQDNTYKNFVKALYKKTEKTKGFDAAQPLHI